MATATSVSRLLNNRHWVSDVMVGAGIGILSTELGYYFADLIFGKKGLRHPQYDFDVTYSDISSFLGLYMGFTMMPHHISLSPEINFNTSTGSTVGVEGAYYITPYVGVGAELLAKNGSVYTGCNIENAAYTPTNCAERTAFFKAVSEGVKEFDAICIVGGKDGVLTEYAPPCGVCRQVMMEFCDPETFQIILATDLEHYDIYTLKELLPLGFGPGNLKEE